MRHGDDKLPLLPCLARLLGNPGEAFLRETALPCSVRIVIQRKKPIPLRQLDNVAHALPVHGDRLVRPKGAVQLP